MNFINAIRCASHTLQLAVIDVLKCEEFAVFIKIIHDSVLKMRNVKYEPSFKNRMSYPPADNITRWGSSFKMISFIAKNKEFFKTLGQIYGELKYSDECWQFIENFVTAFEPVYKITLKFQEEQLLMGKRLYNLLKMHFHIFFRNVFYLNSTLISSGDLFIQWNFVKHKLRVLEDNNIAAKILNKMQHRETNLFSNNAFKCGLFLDPRINFKDSPIISETIRHQAIVSQYKNPI